MNIPKLIEDRKEVFGVCLPMALSNVQTVLDHIRESLELDKDEEWRRRDCMEYERYSLRFEAHPEEYWNHPVMLLLRNERLATPEQMLFIKDKLLRAFPFLRVMAEDLRQHGCVLPYDIDPVEAGAELIQAKDKRSRNLVASARDMYVVLNNAFQVIKAYRDISEHFEPRMDMWADGSDFLKYNEQPMARMLERYFSVALRLVKERYGYKTEDLAFIQNKRFRQEKKNGKKVMVLDPEFFLALQARNGDATGRNHLSANGVVALISLFLEKKYINVFLSKLPPIGRYRSDSPESRVIRRSMGICSVVLPKGRIHSELDRMAVALDMLNELKRCPRELFDTLHPNKQERFRIMSSDHNEVLLMRSTDRFARMLLQYIDSGLLFESLRFHVGMGKLRYLFNPTKTCIDGEVRVRVLEHPLNGFGRLQDMERERRQPNGTFVDSGVSVRGFFDVRRDDAYSAHYPYVVDTYAHYLLENGMVEMRFCDDTGMVMPYVHQSPEGKWYAARETSHCRMSVLELPAMAFHMLLCGPQATESRIRELCDAYHALFSAMREGRLSENNILSFGIAAADIPQKVWDCVRGTHREGKDFVTFQEQVVRQKAAEVERRLERLHSDLKAVDGSDNKQGRRGFVRIMPGRMAAWLAQDICALQPTLRKGVLYGTDRLTGMNYRVLQTAIATYSGADSQAYGKFRDLCCQAGLIGGPQAHPFLDKMMPSQWSHVCPRDTVELYGHYLQEYVRYLKPLLVKMAKGKHPDVPYGNKGQRKWAKRDEAYYQSLADSYLQQPFELPRQMFDAEIRAALQRIPEMRELDFSQANVTWLIGEYLRLVCHDGFQEFYGWARHYRYMDRLACDVDPKKDTLVECYQSLADREHFWQERQQREQQYLHWVKVKDKEKDEESLVKSLAASRRDYQKAEQVIRRYKVQDALLFLMAIEAIKQNADLHMDCSKFRLQDIRPDGESSILSATVPMDFHFVRSVAFGKEENRRVETVKGILHSDGMKVKNFGDFFALASDKRMGTLLRLYPEGEKLVKEDVEQEFEHYDDERPKVVTLTLDLEHWAYDRYPDLRTLAHSQEQFGFSNLLYELMKRSDLNNDERYVLVGIRNSFCHNSYPEDTRIVKVITLPEVAQGLMKRFGRYAVRG